MYKIFLFILSLIINLNFGKHTNNWAVLVSTSRYWFNYRHSANTLSIYRTIKKLGIPDSNIILMLADDVACNKRNPMPAQVFNDDRKPVNLYGEHIEVDYRGYQVTVENFIRVLTDRHDDAVPLNKRLRSDENSNILIFMSGHGGDEFMKFQDFEEISSSDIANAIHQMYEKKRYNEILFMADTCQASTLAAKFYSPNVVSIGSSAKGENSYSHHSSWKIGATLIDRFTYYTLEFFENVDFDSYSEPSLNDLFSYFNPKLLHSNALYRKDLFKRDLRRVPLTDFFGSKIKIHFTEKYQRITPNKFNQTINKIVGKEEMEEKDNIFDVSKFSLKFDPLSYVGTILVMFILTFILNK